MSYLALIEVAIAQRLLRKRKEREGVKAVLSSLWVVMWYW